MVVVVRAVVVAHLAYIFVLLVAGFAVKFLVHFLCEKERDRRRVVEGVGITVETGRKAWSFCTLSYR